MADRMREVIQIVIEALGEAKAAGLVATLRQIGDAGTLADDQLTGLLSGVEALSREASDTRGLQALLQRYRALTDTQGELADAVDRTSLKLRLASEQEASAAEALRAQEAALAQAKSEQEAYADQSERTAEGQRQVRDAVRAAAGAQRAAAAEWRQANSELGTATKNYERAADAQERMQREAGTLATTIRQAGISTDDFAEAQEQLAARAAKSDEELSRLALSAQRAADAAAALAASEVAAEQLRIARAAEEAAAAEYRAADAAERLAESERLAKIEAKELADAAQDFAREQRQAADAMERHRKSAAQAAKDTADLRGETNAATTVFGKLKGMLAGLFSVFSVATLIRGIRSIITESNNSEQALGQLEAALASTGNQAGLSANELLRMADSLRQTSNFSTEQIVSAETRLLSYTNILKEEFPRALQLSIDQAQRLGISVEASAEIVGKALQSPADAMTTLARQGFKLEDGQKSLLKQMVATGRTAEAQAVIMDMLAESYGGAAQAARLGKLAGLWKGLTDRIGEFYARVANAGFIEHLKSRLEALQATIGQMADDGRLDAWARRISDALVSIARAIEGSIRFVASYAQAIVLLGKAYALVKVASFLQGLAAVASGAEKASGAVRLLSALILKIPAIQIAVIGGAAIALAANHVRDLGQAIGGALPATKRWEDRLAALRAEIVAGSERFRAASERLAEYASTQVKTAAEVAKLTDAERASYAERITGLQEYLRLQVKYYEQLKNAEALNADGLAHLGSLRERLAAAAKGYDDIAVGAKLAAAALDNDVTPAAQKLIGELESIGESSKLARERLDEVFRNFENMDFVQLGDLALALQHIGEESDVTSRRVRDGLSAELSKLSGQDLQKFQMAATAAFDETGRSGDRAAVVLRTTLQVALEKLGVSVSRTGVAVSDVGKDIVATFQTVSDNAQATSRQVEEAFKAALGGVQTREEAEALGAALESAGDRGRISAEGTERAMLALQRRLRELRAEIDPLADEFDVLGIKSQASLNAVRDSAREAFEAIVEGAREGRAAREDVVRALNAWAEAERDAAAQSTASQQASVETLLSGRAASLGLSNALVAVGDAGKDAGDKTALAMDSAADAMGAAADAAAAMADANAKTAESADRAGESITNITTLTDAQRASLRMLGQEWMAGRRSAQDYAREVQASMADAADSIEEQIDAAERAAQALRDMRAELQDDADRAAGNEEAVEERRHAERLREIRELEEQGGAAAQREAAEVRRLADEEHKRRLAEIRDRARAERESARETARSSAEDTAAGPSDRSPTVAVHELRITVNGDAVGSFDPGNPLVESQIMAAVHAALRRAAAASGNGGGLRW